MAQTRRRTPRRLRALGAAIASFNAYSDWFYSLCLCAAPIATPSARPMAMPMARLSRASPNPAPIAMPIAIHFPVDCALGLLEGGVLFSSDMGTSLLWLCRDQTFPICRSITRFKIYSRIFSRHRLANVAATSIRYSAEAHSSVPSWKALRAAVSRPSASVPSIANVGLFP